MQKPKKAKKIKKKNPDDEFAAHIFPNRYEAAMRKDLQRIENLINTQYKKNLSPRELLFILQRINEISGKYV